MFTTVTCCIRARGVDGRIKEGVLYNYRIGSSVMMGMNGMD